MEFKDKVVVITGSSSGIGAGIAEEYAKHGAKLIINGRDKQRIREVATKCEEYGAKKVDTILANISSSDDVETFTNDVIRLYDHVDVLVLNAGTSVVCSFEQHSMEDFDRIFNTNVRAHFHITKLLITHVKACKGTIVVVSSNTAHRTPPSVIAYGMAKSALNYFTKALANEYAKHGVRVVGVSPGLVRTRNMVDECKLTSQQIEQVMEGTAMMQPLGGMMKPEDVAKTVLFLTSKGASCITGHTVAIENGYSPFHLFPSF